MIRIKWFILSMLMFFIPYNLWYYSDVIKHNQIAIVCYLFIWSTIVLIIIEVVKWYYWIKD